MSAAPQLLSLLQALISGECASELWASAAVEHYPHPASEDARVRLVRAALEAGEWAWPNVPMVLKRKAEVLLSELSTNCE